MKKCLLFLVLLCAGAAHAQSLGSFQQWCQAGGQDALTQGLASTWPVQLSYPQCQVSVYNTGTTVLATIYSSSTLTPLASQFCANTDGSFLFYAANSIQYDVVIANSNACNPAPTYAQLPSAFTFFDVGVSGSGGGGGGGSGTVNPGVQGQAAYYPASTNAVSSTATLVFNSTNATFSLPVITPGLTDSGLTNGDCVQAGVGGLLGNAAGPCGTVTGFIPASGLIESGTLLGLQSCSNNQVLQYVTGTGWQCATFTGGSITGGGTGTYLTEWAGSGASTALQNSPFFVNSATGNPVTTSNTSSLNIDLNAANNIYPAVLAGAYPTTAACSGTNNFTISPRCYSLYGSLSPAAGANSGLNVAVYGKALVSSTSSPAITGVYGYASTTNGATDTANYISGLVGVGDVQGTSSGATQANIFGVYGLGRSFIAGSPATLIAGVYGQTDVGSGSVAASAASLYAAPPIAGSSTNPTTQYGLYVADQSTGGNATHYGIYQAASNNPNFFNGNTVLNGTLTLPFTGTSCLQEVGGVVAITGSACGSGGGGGTGTVTSVAAGTGLTASPSPITTSGTLSVSTNGITNSLLAAMPATTVKCNTTSGSANAADCTASQVSTLLSLGSLATLSLVTPALGGTGLNTSSSTGILQFTSGTASLFTTLPTTYFPALTGDVTNTAGTVATTVGALKNVPFCSGFTPTNGQTLVYSTGLSPNPCYTAQTFSGSGTVNSGTATQLAFYSSTGTTVSGDANVTDTGAQLQVTEPVQMTQANVNGSGAGMTVRGAGADLSSTCTALGNSDCDEANATIPTSFTRVGESAGPTVTSVETYAAVASGKTQKTFTAAGTTVSGTFCAIGGTCAPGSSSTQPPRTITANYTLAATDFSTNAVLVIPASVTSTITISLPASITPPANTFTQIVNQSSSIQVAISTSGGATVNGVSNVYLVQSGATAAAPNNVTVWSTSSSGVYYAAGYTGSVVSLIGDGVLYNSGGGCVGPCILGTGQLAQNAIAGGLLNGSSTTAFGWTQNPTLGAVGGLSGNITYSGLTSGSQIFGCTSGTCPALGGGSTNLIVKSYGTAQNCAGVGSAANPSLVSCGSAASGRIACNVAASGGTCTVSETGVSANSVITVEQVSYLNAALSVTCATAPVAQPLVSSVTAGTGFTVTLPTFTNSLCMVYMVEN